MIVPMKRVTVLCTLARQEITVQRLGELGVLHVVHVQPPAGDDLDEARRRLTYLRRALEVLPTRAVGEPTDLSAEQVVEEIWKLIHAAQAQEERLEVLRHERERIRPFGDFDPALVRKLEEAGIFVRLYRAAPRSRFQAPEGAALLELGRDRQGVYLALISRDPEASLAAEKVRLPERPLGEIEREIARLEEALAENRRRLAAFAADRPKVESIVEEVQDRVNYLEVRRGMGQTEPVAYLRGYCPRESVEALRRAAAEAGWGLIIEDPRPGEAVPTLLRPPRWARPIRALLDMIGVVPGYDEVDISAVFLVFFSVFFGMLVGDGGYGLLFLLATLALKRRLPPTARDAVRLLLITSSTTILWGSLTGTWFGIENLPAPLRGLKIDWLSDDNHLIETCFFIGAVHLSLAHLWNMWRMRRQLRALAQVGWFISTWFMFFVARTLVLGFPFPQELLYPFAAGVALIVLFTTPWRQIRTEWFEHVMLPLNLIGNFVDLVSYVRLFAVGAATLAVASAFNDMALGLGAGSAVGKAVAAVVLFVGHGMNILMAIMGVLVHGIRLNTLEFCNHMGVQWKGFPYRPFARLRRRTAAAAPAQTGTAAS